ELNAAAASPVNAPNFVFSIFPSGVVMSSDNLAMAVARQPRRDRAPSAPRTTPASRLFDAPDNSTCERVKPPALASGRPAGTAFTTPPIASDPYSTLAGP